MPAEEEFGFYNQLLLKLTICGGGSVMGWLLLESLLLALHLLCVNVTAGAPLIVAWFEWKGPADPLARRAGDYLSLAAWTSLLVGASLGLIIGWLRWNEEAATIWTGVLRYRLWSSVGELGFSLVILVALWAWRRRIDLSGTVGRIARGLLAVLASTNLLYHFPVLFLIFAKLRDAAVRAELSLTLTERLPRSAFYQLLGREEVPSLSVHIAAASLAVAGMLLFGLALRIRREGDEPGASRVATWGGWWSLLPTLAQLPIGLWVLVSLPTPLQGALTGNSLPAAGCFGLSLLAAFWLVQELAQTAFGDHTRGRLMRAMTAMFVTVLLMTAAHQLGRAAVQPNPVVQTTPANGLG
jgi:hypothetical protein